MTNEMTAEEAIQWLDAIKKYYIHGGDEAYDKKRMKALDMAIKVLKQQSFINKPCISEGVCREDKIQVLEKIRAEIEQLRLHKAEFLTSDNKVCIDSQGVLNIIDKYRAESEGEE